MWKSIVALALLILIGAGIWQMMTSTQPVSSGSAMLEDIPGEEIPKLLSGSKVTLLNMWASWCEPCKAEFPALLEFRKKYLDKGFNLIFVTVDHPSERAAAEAFLASQNVDFKTYLATGSPETWVPKIDPRWQGAVPSSFVFDSSGKTVDFWQGETNLKELEEKITPRF